MPQKDGERREQAVRESTAMRRLEDLIEEWESTHTEKLSEGKFVMWGAGEHDLDLRDLQLILAVAKGESGNRAGYLDLAERAIKGWQLSNANQAKALGRLSEQRTEVLKTVGGAYGISDPAVVIRRVKEIYNGK